MKPIKQNQSEDEKKMLRQQLEEEFRTCFEAQQHGASTNRDFTVSLYWRYLGHASDAYLNFHTNRLLSGSMTRQQLEEEFRTCVEAQQHGTSTNRDFTVSLYWRYLGHAPDANLNFHTQRLDAQRAADEFVPIGDAEANDNIDIEGNGTQIAADEFLPIGDAEAEVLAAVTDDAIHTQLSLLTERLEQYIVGRYYFTLALAALAEKLHKKQADHDRQIEIDDEIALVGDVILITSLLLAPLTGGASLAAMAVDATVLAAGEIVGAGVQLYGSYSSYLESTMSNEDAKKALDELKIHVDADSQLLQNIETMLLAFDEMLAQRYADMRKAALAADSNYGIPTLTEFSTMVKMTHSIPNLEFNELRNQMKGNWKKFQIAKFTGSTLRTLAKTFKIVRLVLVVVKNRRFLHTYAPVNALESVGPQPLTSLLDVLSEAFGRDGQLESARIVDAARTDENLVTELSDAAIGREIVSVSSPGILSRAERFGLKARLGLKYVSNVLPFVSLVLDINDLMRVEERISGRSWSESAKEIEKIRIRAEAQLQTLIVFRATLDLAQFEEPYCFLQHAASGKYLSVNLDESTLQFEQESGHLNNINMHFSGLAIQTQSSQTNPTPAFLMHRLSAKYVTVLATYAPYQLIVRDNKTAKFRFQMMDDALQTGYLAVKDLHGTQSPADCVAALVNASGLDAQEGDSYWKKLAEREQKGEIAPYAAGYDPLRKEQYKFIKISGAKPEQTFIPNYGYLQNAETGAYVIFDLASNMFKVVDETPSELDAFALASNRCIQHRFTRQCLKPGPNNSLLFDTRPQADCQWEFGEASGMSMGRRLVNLSTGHVLTLEVFANGAKSLSVTPLDLSEVLIVSGENQSVNRKLTWLFQPLKRTYLGLGIDNNLYTATTLSGDWERVTTNSPGNAASEPNDLNQITIMQDGTILGVSLDPHSEINVCLWSRKSFRDADPWTVIPNSYGAISAAMMPDGTILGFGIGSLLLTREMLNDPWEMLNDPSVIAENKRFSLDQITVMLDRTIPGTGLDQITVMLDGTILGTGILNLWTRKSLSSPWEKGPDNTSPHIMSISILKDGTLFGIERDPITDSGTMWTRRTLNANDPWVNISSGTSMKSVVEL